MKICILGNHSGKTDEGMASITQKITTLLKDDSQYDVLPLVPHDINSRSFWRSLKSFSPDIVHYIPGPTIRSLVVLEIIRKRLRNVLTVSSATRPYFSSVSRLLVPLLKPNLILIQSGRSEKFFQQYGCKTWFLPNGVDISQFYPLERSSRQKLRKRYGIAKDTFLLLHVGSIRRNRNLEILSSLQKEGNLQVLIVGSTFHPANKDVYDQLESTGCLIWHRYFEDMNQIYNLADCYIFPTRDYDHALMPPSYNYVGSIDMPLSVMEAMACNLPVISTPFSALSKVFEEGGGLFYFRNPSEIPSRITKVTNGLDIQTREKVTNYSWQKVIEQLKAIYEKLRSSIRNAE